MKKVVVSVVLGILLLATSRAAAADQDRAREPNWSIRPERSSSLSPLDFARWLARRLNDGTALPVPIPAAPSPKPSPVPGDSPDEVCTPERVHCPIT